MHYSISNCSVNRTLLFSFCKYRTPLIKMASCFTFFLYFRVTKEHRENLAKNAKAMFTKCKDRIKGVQVKFVKSVKKKEGVSADVLRNVEQQIVAIADGYVAEAETVTKSKQSELVGGD